MEEGEETFDVPVTVNLMRALGSSRSANVLAPLSFSTACSEMECGPRFLMFSGVKVNIVKFRKNQVKYFEIPVFLTSFFPHFHNHEFFLKIFLKI